MSLACFECNRIGSFDTLIIFDPKGTFNPTDEISHYANFYTDCARITTFKAVEKSRFMIVKTKGYEDSLLWAMPCILSETEFQFVDESELEKRLPKIFAALKK